MYSKYMHLLYNRRKNELSFLPEFLHTLQNMINASCKNGNVEEQCFLRYGNGLLDDKSSLASLLYIVLRPGNSPIIA